MTPLPLVVVMTTPPDDSEGTTRTVDDGFDVPVTVAANVTVCPARGFPNWSLIVTVTSVAMEVPSAGTLDGVTTTVDVDGDGAGSSKSTWVVAAMARLPSECPPR